VRDGTALAERRSAGKRDLCPVRLGLLAFGLLLICAYFVLRSDHGLMVSLSDGFVQPLHRFLSGLCDRVSFSVAEALYALAAVALTVYIIYSVVQFIRKPQRLKRLYRFVLTLAAAGALIYGGFCLLWGVYYYGDSFSQCAGLADEPVSVEQLELVTAYFAEIANRYSDSVARDENGSFAVDRDWILARGATVYENAEKVFPCLAAEERSPKPIMFSKIMSYMEFTGFFFPFTGEANVNMDSPACMLPATVAHELAHQRGVAKEQEANFAAVAACMESGEETFMYSGALLAYSYLGNALYDADYARWEAVYNTLNGQVRQDFRENSEYWSEYEGTAVGKATDAVYEGLLQSYGQSLGLKSYGACVDLLAAYYYDTALEAMEACS